jgi:hypothetical protein
MIFEAAMAGAEARAALALEMHIRATPDLIARAYRDGTLIGSSLPQPDNEAVAIATTAAPSTGL